MVKLKWVVNIRLSFAMLAFQVNSTQKCFYYKLAQKASLAKHPITLADGHLSFMTNPVVGRSHTCGCVGGKTVAVGSSAATIPSTQIA